MRLLQRRHLSIGMGPIPYFPKKFVKQHQISYSLKACFQMVGIFSLLKELANFIQPLFQDMKLKLRIQIISAFDCLPFLVLLIQQLFSKYNKQKSLVQIRLNPQFFFNILYTKCNAGITGFYFNHFISVKFISRIGVIKVFNLNYIIIYEHV